MPSADYYRRQSELCLRLALLQDDQHTTYRLVELAKDLQARAEEAGSEPGSSMPAHMIDPNPSGVDGPDRS